MKATGIVRRIDDLGRVVIPQGNPPYPANPEGDPLEIYTEKDGGVIFRKYSPMGDLQDFAAQICESIGKNTGRIAAVSDRDSIIALSGAPGGSWWTGGTLRIWKISWNSGKAIATVRAM